MAIFAHASGRHAGRAEFQGIADEAELLRRFLAVLAAHEPFIPLRFLPEKDSLGQKRTLAPNALACLRWLGRVEAIAAAQAKPLVALLREGGAFCWGQTYQAEDFGEAFLENYGWLEVFGARGHFVHAGIAGGLLLLGPNTLYPEHRHLAEEIYLPLTGGSDWRMDGEPFRSRRAGEIVNHASNVGHAMRTGAEPLLALYLWRGGPLDQRSAIDAASQPASQPLKG